MKIAHEVTDAGCWECTSHRPDWKQGIVILQKGGKEVRLHRWFYENEKGKIRKGLIVVHTCENKKCVNPGHMWLAKVSHNYKKRKN